MNYKILKFAYLFIFLFGFQAQSQIVVSKDLVIVLDHNRTPQFIQNEKISNKKVEGQPYCKLEIYEGIYSEYTFHDTQIVIKEKTITGKFILKKGVQGTKNIKEYAGLHGMIAGISTVVYPKLFCFSGTNQNDEISKRVEINKVLEGVLRFDYDFDPEFELPF